MQRKKKQKQEQKKKKQKPQPTLNAKMNFSWKQLAFT